MSRRWLQSADVEVSDRGALATSLAAPVIGQGEKLVGNTTVPLVATTTPCSRVWIGAATARHTKGSANADIILVGMQPTTEQNQSGGIPLEPSNVTGFWYPVTDASRVYLTGFDPADVVEFQIVQ